MSHGYAAPGLTLWGAMKAIFSDNDHLRGDGSRSKGAVSARFAVEEVALEPHFSIKEIAEIWGLCENSVRDLFKDEPGVVRIQRPRSRFKRAYTTLRIPRSVLDRVHRRMSAIS
jgi:hypothetical protein